MNNITCPKCNSPINYKENETIQNLYVCISCKAVINVVDKEEVSDNEWLYLSSKERDEINHLLNLVDEKKSIEMIDEIHRDIITFKELIGSDIDGVPITDMQIDFFKFYLLNTLKFSEREHLLFRSILGLMEFFKDLKETHQKIKEILAKDKNKELDIVDMIKNKYISDKKIH
jgi:DNA-directed RNA polymerase subunit RPC12/RpoP